MCGDAGDSLLQYLIKLAFVILLKHYKCLNMKIQTLRNAFYVNVVLLYHIHGVHSTTYFHVIKNKILSV